MSGNQNILIEKDLLEDVGPAVTGDSAIGQCLPGGNKLSLQLIYDVLAFSPVVVPSAAITFGTGDDESTFTLAAHGFYTGLKVQIATSSALPAPLAALTDYFVIVISDSVFKLAASYANAIAGTNIDLTDAGVGNQTVTAVALAGGSVGIYLSNDNVNYTLAQTATSISADGSTLYLLPNVTTKYIKVTKALTAGAIDLKAILILTGDAI